ncbi:MAG: FKBP-type peptidyl-prolyl cis-trans isomerase [Actinobacteria bacterium]|nr:FKBP-type peptidyl-prolyl cis-trans isomerase [Actinomycetota bacterium]
MAALVALAIAALVLTRGGDDAGVTSPASTTTLAPAENASAAGKPCVGTSGDLPPGAPAVPVRKGPPPEELVIEDLKLGDGPPVSANATVSVNYIGVACSTGKIFDSSYSRNQPATFPLNGVIQGWQAGIPGMKVGGQRLLGIPPEQAYGAAGRPPDILADETLWFVVEVVGIDSA